MATEEELADAEIEAARQRVDRQAQVVAAIVLEAVTQGAERGGSSSQLMMVWPAQLQKAVASLSKLTALAVVVALLPRKKRGSGAEPLEPSKSSRDSDVAAVPTAPTRDQLLDQIQPDVDRMVRKIVEQDVVAPARQRQLREMKGHDAPQTPTEARHWSDLVGRTAATRAASEIAVSMAEPIQKMLETELVKVWLSRGDSRVRPLHRELHSKTARMGDPFWQELGTGRELRYPGDPKAPIEQVANCRCHLFLARADEARAAEDVFHMDDSEFALAASGTHVLYQLALDDLRAVRAAARPGPDEQFEGMVVVLIPDGLDDIEYKDGDTAPAHSTLAYLGNLDQATDEEIDDVRATARRLAEIMGPFTAKVAGKATLGDKDDEVLLIEAREIQDLHDTLDADPTCGRLLAERNEHPHFIPHITYPHDKAPDEIKFVKIGCWIGDEKQEFDLQ